MPKKNTNRLNKQQNQQVRGQDQASLKTPEWFRVTDFQMKGFQNESDNNDSKEIDFVLGGSVVKLIKAI